MVGTNDNIMFTKAERSTFPYWFAHWCAFQMTALNLHMWKPKYLFHDWEKPWLRLFLPYEKVQKWHRYHHNHHFEWLEKYSENHSGNVSEMMDKYDWEAMLIDWECSQYTKVASPKNAWEQYETWFGSKENKEKWKDKYPNLYCWGGAAAIRSKMILMEYNFPAKRKERS